jgi:hypothetical protein
MENLEARLTRVIRSEIAKAKQEILEGELLLLKSINSL